MWSVRGEFPCALMRMSSLTLRSTTPLSQVMSSSSSTTTTSQRPLKFSSRSPPATPNPRTCMTRRSMTTPSAKRSLHHCSLRSEKNLRAVDKLITLLKKVCCQVCLSVKFFERQRKSMSRLRNEQIRILLDDNKSRFSLIVEQRFRNNYIGSELQCCKDESVQVISWCHDQHDVCQ